ncbi:MAG: NAD(P)-dependent oxidoreductase [Ardenticatenaceae bacterium]|nr:NAD(P)-dependent oxidoreductase [Ardenticatenaceae bacterium]MCB9445726.1 NAD(P)-dependent oxidoreductase [Ardenticatenaceae bacterium]
MRILLTGGAGDLGLLLARELDLQGDTPTCLDIRPPQSQRGIYIPGSILDRDLLQNSLDGVDLIVHIAAWHGIHEVTQAKDAFEFWDLNVTGTFNVFETAVRTGISKIVHISSTSVRDEDSIYGQSKILAEQIASNYKRRHNLDIIVLRPRAFIPHWNRLAYNTFVEWAKWFWPGAVHINDVTQAVLLAVNRLKQQSLAEMPVLTIDGAYDYQDDDLANWDQDGPGTTFRKYFADYYDLAIQYGLDPALRPKKLDISLTQKWLGYEPQYSLKNLLQELAQFGEDGPPLPKF